MGGGDDNNGGTSAVFALGTRRQVPGGEEEATPGRYEEDHFDSWATDGKDDEVSEDGEPAGESLPTHLCVASHPPQRG